MSANQTQTLLISFLISTLRGIYQESGKVEMSLGDIEDILKAFQVSDEDTKDKGKKKTSVKVKRVVNPEEQCTALKKDGERCGGKKHEKGENKELCTLHNLKGVKFGLFEGQSEETPIEKQCEYRYPSGSRKNKQCSNKLSTEGDFCKLHAPKNDEEFIQEENF